MLKRIAKNEIKNNLKYHIQSLFDAILNFKSDPINNFTIILTFVSIAISFIGFIVAWIIFIASGGYGEQIETIKTLGIFSGSLKSFTSGTVHILYGDIVALLIIVLLSFEVILMFYQFFTHETKTKKIIMIVDLSLFALLGILYALFEAINTEKIILTEEQMIALINFCNSIKIKGISIIIILFFALLIISLATFLTIIIKCDEIQILKTIVISAIASFVLIPLILLFFENFIPLIMGIVALCIIAFLLWGLFAIVGLFSDVNNKKTIVMNLEKGSYKIKDTNGNVLSEIDIQ